MSTAVELEPTLRYDAKRDVFIRLATARSSATTATASSPTATEELEPGWKTGVGTRTSPRSSTTRSSARRSCRVFIWTFVFAAVTVVLSFAIGLFLAIALDKQGMRFQRTYRSI